jgi:ABC-type Mn2+/Zn2+ transport system ATPase subunit
MGHGPLSMTIKYFDSSVATRNIKVAVAPERIIEITPFKLNLFEVVKGHIEAFRKELQCLQGLNITELTLAAQSIRITFQEYPKSTAASFADRRIDLIDAEVALGENFTDEALRITKSAELTDLTRATSVEGLTALRSEQRDLESLISSLEKVQGFATSGWAFNLAQTSSALVEKRMEQRALAEVFIPKGVSLDGFMALLELTAAVCPLDEAEGHNCPLCQRSLGEYEIELFKRYHELLNGLVEKDIETLQTSLTKAEEHLAAITAIKPEQWRELVTIPPNLLAEAINVTEPLFVDSKAVQDPSVESMAALLSLGALVNRMKELANAKENAIISATADRTTLLASLSHLQQEVGQLNYASAVATNLAKFKAVQQKMKIADFWDGTFAGFPPVLKRITTKAKVAYVDLVVSDFETRLNAEYSILAERSMESFCVKLAQKGEEATVTMLPQVGGEDIGDVLSEGEQTVHALALFFAELETCSHCVLVFDDPIASFDYNYSDNFANRLAKFCKEHPQRQVIVLTHSWECFVQLQLALRRKHLSQESSIQVIESCRQIAEYSDKLDALKEQINTILNMNGEPTPQEKESLAGDLRRLIETVVNSLVFNNERHQFKQKPQSVSTFEQFTKVTPLTVDEAALLKELFAKLSHSEHDDPLNDYTTASKASFQTRFDQIMQVASSIESRVPEWPN